MPTLHLENHKLVFKPNELDDVYIDALPAIIQFLESNRLESKKKASTVSSADSIEVNSENAPLLIEELRKKQSNSYTEEQFAILKATISPQNHVAVTRLIQPLTNYNDSTFNFFKNHLPDSKEAIGKIKGAFFKMLSEIKSDEKKPVDVFMKTITDIRNKALLESINEQKPLFGGYVESLQNIIYKVEKQYNQQEPSPPWHMIKNGFSYLTPLEKYSSSRLKITKHYIQESKDFLKTIKPLVLNFVLNPDAKKTQELLQTINDEISKAVVKAVAAGRDFTSQGGYIDLLIKFKHKILTIESDRYNLDTMKDSLDQLKKSYPNISPQELSKKMQSILKDYTPTQIKKEEYASFPQEQEQKHLKSLT